MALNTYGGPGEKEDNPFVFGTPMEPKPADDGGAGVDPQMGAETGGVDSAAAAPSMAKGGAIPDDDYTGEASPNTDVVDYTGAMAIVRQALNYGREQHGLPASRPQSAGDSEQAAIPDEEDSTESYAAGGAIADDIEAGNNSQPDEQQYGRPEVLPVAQNGESPPISGDNLDVSGVMGDESSGLNTDNPAAGANPAAATASVPDDSPPPLHGPQGGITDEADMSPGEGGVKRPANPQLAMRYLEAAGAAPPEALSEYRKKLGAEGKTLAEQNLLAVSNAPKEQQFPLMQTQRAGYNSFIGRALAALNGVQGKPPDLDHAAQAASKAYDNLLDGVTTSFKAEGDKVIAHVKPPNSDKAQTFSLTPQQFAAVLDPGKGGQYDALLDNGGAAGALKLASALQTQAPAPAPGGATTRANFDPTKLGLGASKLAPAAAESKARPQQDANDPAAVAARLYPMASQGAQRAAAEIKLREQAAKAAGRGGHGKDYDREEKLELLKQQGRAALDQGKTGRATLGNDARTQHYNQMFDAKMKEIAARSANVGLQERRAMVSSLVNAAGGMDKLSKEQQDVAKGIYNGTINNQPQGAAAPQLPSFPQGGGQLTKAQIGEILRKRGLLQ